MKKNIFSKTAIIVMVALAASFFSCEMSDSFSEELPKKEDKPIEYKHSKIVDDVEVFEVNDSTYNSNENFEVRCLNANGEENGSKTTAYLFHNKLRAFSHGEVVKVTNKSLVTIPNGITSSNTSDASNDGMTKIKETQVMWQLNGFEIWTIYNSSVTSINACDEKVVINSGWKNEKLVSMNWGPVLGEVTENGVIYERYLPRFTITATHSFDQGSKKVYNATVYVQHPIWVVKGNVPVVTYQDRNHRLISFDPNTGNGVVGFDWVTFEDGVEKSFRTIDAGGSLVVTVPADQSTIVTAWPTITASAADQGAWVNNNRTFTTKTNIFNFGFGLTWTNSVASWTAPENGAVVNFFVPTNLISVTDKGISSLQDIAPEGFYARKSFTSTINVMVGTFGNKDYSAVGILKMFVKDPIDIDDEFYGFSIVFGPDGTPYVSYTVKFNGEKTGEQGGVRGWIKSARGDDPWVLKYEGSWNVTMKTSEISATMRGPICVVPTRSGHTLCYSTDSGKINWYSCERATANNGVTNFTKNELTAIGFFNGNTVVNSAATKVGNNYVDTGSFSNTEGNKTVDRQVSITVSKDW